MFNLLKHFVQVREAPTLARKRIFLKNLVLIGLGAMVLIVIALLSGCGSDSTPGKGEKPKTAIRSGPLKPQSGIPFLKEKEGTAPDKAKLSQKPPDARLIEIAPGISQEELEAKMASDRAKYDPSFMEVIPGISRKEVEAKVAADRAKYDPSLMEVFPGITRKEVEAKVAANRAKHDPRSMEVFPGITRKEVEAKVAAGRAEPAPRLMETLPPQKELR